MDYLATKSYLDKSKWSDGEWQKEQDYYYWIDKTTELDCLIVRNGLGGLCGYVGLPEIHCFYGKDYGYVEESANISVHGGLTYSASCDENNVICHTEGMEVWWLGFDCSHHGDLTPSMSQYSYIKFAENKWETYKNLDYVSKEVESFAQQLATFV